MQLRERRRVDGLGRLKFDFHTGLADAAARRRRRRAPTAALPRRAPRVFAFTRGRLPAGVAQCLNQIVAARVRHCYYHGPHVDPIHWLICAQAPQCLERLLRHGGFDVSSKAHFKPVGVVTPLEVAVRRGCAACVALLLRAGATPSTADAYQGAKRGRGASSAHVLTKLLSDRVLVDLDAPLDDTTKETLLHTACRHGQADFARLLLTWGASCPVRKSTSELGYRGAITLRRWRGAPKI